MKNGGESGRSVISDMSTVDHVTQGPIRHIKEFSHYAKSDRKPSKCHLCVVDWDGARTQALSDLGCRKGERESKMDTQGLEGGSFNHPDNT